MTLYVGNLSYQVDREDLNEFLGDYRTVKSWVIPLDLETGKLRGFGFVEMKKENDEVSAISALDSAEWMGRQLRVNQAKPKQDDRFARSRSPSVNSGQTRH